MLLLLVLFLIWLVIMLFSRLSLLGVQAHWHKNQTVIAEYETPHNLTPAELGYIFDRRFGRHELKATVLSMYRRNILSLTQKRRIFGKDLLITKSKTKSTPGLDDCEAVLLASVMYSEGGQRSLNDMTSIFSRETGARWQYEKAVIGQLIDKGYLTEGAKNEPFADRFLKSAVGFGFTWIAFYTSWGFEFLGNQNLGIGFAKVDTFLTRLAVIPLFLVAWLLMYTYLSILTREIHLSAGVPRFATEKLRNQWRDVVGYRDYLRVVEWNRLKTKPDIANKALPYCLACGFRVNIFEAIGK